jgi:hypothetical protein
MLINYAIGLQNPNLLKVKKPKRAMKVVKLNKYHHEGKEIPNISHRHNFSVQETPKEHFEKDSIFNDKMPAIESRKNLSINRSTNENKYFKNEIDEFFAKIYDPRNQKMRRVFKKELRQLEKKIHGVTDVHSKEFQLEYDRQKEKEKIGVLRAKQRIKYYNQPLDQSSNLLFGMTSVKNPSKKATYSKNVESLVNATAIQISGPAATRLKQLLEKKWSDRYWMKPNGRDFAPEGNRTSFLNKQ